MLLPLTLDRAKPLQQQLHDQVRALIESGALPVGLRMPSTRALAEHFSVSRMTVLLTYERLTAAGLLHTTPSGGTFVGLGPNASPAQRSGAKPPAARDAAQIVAEVGQPDPALFPSARWRVLLRAAAAQFGVARCDRQPSARAALQATLAKWLLGTRGLDVAPEQIVIVGARQRALEIVAHLLLRPGERVAFEAPGDDVAASIWAARGAHLVSVPVDRAGLITERLPSRTTALAYVTPSFQYPLGVTLAPARRQELLAWAEAGGAYIAEVDRIGDLRYDHEHPRALMGEDRHSRVLYVGDFSSVLGPWVATAYLVVPPHLVAAAESARRIFDDHEGGIELRVLAGFIESTAYPRHLLQVRRIYAGRRQALIRALRAQFGACDPLGVPGGFALAWTPAAALGSLDRIVAAADACGLPVETLPALPVSDGTPAERLLLIGFSQLTEEQIAMRVARLAALLRPRSFESLADHAALSAEFSEEQAAD